MVDRLPRLPLRVHSIERRLRCRLENYSASCCQCGPDLGHGQELWIVPGSNCAHDSYGFFSHDGGAHAAGSAGLECSCLDEICHGPQDRYRSRCACAHRQGGDHSGLPADELCSRSSSTLEAVGEAPHHCSSLVGGAAPPGSFLECGPCGVHSRIDLLGPAHRSNTQRALGCCLEHRCQIGGARFAPLAVDEETFTFNAVDDRHYSLLPRLNPIERNLTIPAVRRCILPPFPCARNPGTWADRSDTEASGASCRGCCCRCTRTLHA